jgi:hypothetical protein
VRRSTSNHTPASLEQLRCVVGDLAAFFEEFSAPVEQIATLFRQGIAAIGQFPAE